MTGFLQDIRFTFRTLARRPVFFAGAVLSLALGIGANSAIFSCVNAILLRPLPVEEPARLVAVYSTAAQVPGELMGVSYPNYLDLRESNDAFSDLLVYRPVPMRLELGEGTESLTGEMVSGNYFRILGVRPALGRTFLPDEDATPGTHPVVVLSHRLWEDRFGSDTGILGKTVRLNGTRFTVIGVAPAGFNGLGVLGSPDLWVPTMMHSQVLFGRIAEWFDDRDALILNCVGRLEPGSSLERAQAATTAVADRLRREYPTENEGIGAALVPLAEATLPPAQRRQFVLAGQLLMIAVGTLLLVACANVANLLLARALERRKEIAVRLALGPGRGRLLRQLVTEGLVLAALGGALGLLLASWAVSLLWSLRPPFLPETLDLGLDGRVLLFTLGVSTLTGVLFGLVPARAARFDLVPALKDLGTPGTGGAGAGRRFGLRHLLLVIQVSLSLIALVGAGLFLVSLRNAERTDLGFESRRLLLVSTDLGPQGLDEARGRGFLELAAERIGSLPGVRSVAVAERAPLDLRGDPQMRVFAETRNPAGDLVRFNSVSPRYFETVGAPLLKGRAFAEADRPDTPSVAVINETMARLFWPGRDAVGQRFRVDGQAGEIAVVGVARDASYQSVGQESTPYFYLSLTQHYSPAVTFHVLTEGDPAPLLQTVRREVQTLDRTLPTEERTISEVLARSLWAPRAAAGLLSLFSLLALLLAVTGLYSVMAYAVQQRAREMGIRLALGAQRGDLLRLILREGLTWVAVGVAAGCVAALAAAPLTANLLYGVQGRDPIVYLGAALILLAVSLLANLLPARQAAKLDPLLVLRHR
jgi:macrolide transport system ATP-binding/permease protein